MNNNNKSGLLGRLSNIDEGIGIVDEMAPSAPLLLSKELISEHTIMSEYALVCRDPIDGLYTVPSASNYFEWFGVLFIRRGVYTGAVLRFTLYIPTDFPSTTIPSVKFDLNIFHPYIEPESRELDLKRSFPDGWKPDVHHIYHVLVNVQRTFFIIDGDQVKCANKEAAQMLQNDREAFKARASELIRKVEFMRLFADEYILIRKSRSIIYDTVTSGDPHAIRLSPWNASVHESLRQWLIGALTDSQISTSSMLGSSNSGSSTVNESRSKVGFSWFSPTTRRYMVEPRRPDELGSTLTVRCNAVPPDASPDFNQCRTEQPVEDAVSNSLVIAELTRLDLSDVLDDDGKKCV